MNSKFPLNQDSDGALWYYANIDNAVIGPIPFLELKQLLKSGSITVETQVVPDGSSDWVRCGDIINSEQVSSDTADQVASVQQRHPTGCRKQLITFGFIFLVVTVMCVAFDKYLDAKEAESYGKRRVQEKADRPIEKSQKPEPRSKSVKRFSVTPEQFRTAFNRKAIEFGCPDHFQLQKIEVKQKSGIGFFEASFSDNLMLMGEVSEDQQGISDVTIIGSSENSAHAMEQIALSVLTVAVLDTSVHPKLCGEAISKLYQQISKGKISGDIGYVHLTVFPYDLTGAVALVVEPK